MMDFCTVKFTTSVATRIGNYLDVYIEADKPAYIKPKVVKKAKGFCLNEYCISKSEPHKIDVKHYRFNYNTQDKKQIECPSCQYALYWTTRWEKLDGYKDKDFKYKERPTLCY